MMLREVGQLHDSFVSLLISPGGVGGFGSLEIVVIATRKHLPSGAVPPSVSLRQDMMPRQPGLMANVVYQLLMKLDAECTRQWWRNEEFLI
jgi:hypothetical protein